MTDAVAIAAEVDLLVGLVICIGIIASYVPQHVQCLKLHSAEGLSLWTVLICTLSGSALTLACFLSDFFSIQDAALNQDVSLALRILQTMRVCMPTFQNLLSVCFGIPTYAIYYFWFSAIPRVNADSEEHETTNYELIPRDGSKHRFEVVAAAMTWMMVALEIAVSVWALLILEPNSYFTKDLVKFYGVTAALCNTVQWIPQIDKTWSAQHEGVLSLAVLIFSVVGDVILLAFWIRGTDESGWVDITLVSDAGMQMILIAMILHFRRKRRQHLVAGELDERMMGAPLLSLPDENGFGCNVDQSIAEETSEIQSTEAVL
jgi:uncharacterized protein with PQ loop repeat